MVEMVVRMASVHGRAVGVALLLVLTLGAAACGGSPSVPDAVADAGQAGAGGGDAAAGAGQDDAVSDADEGLSVVVTTTVLGSLVSDVVGEDGTVEVLMPVGADPHGFAPSAAQTTAAEQADLIVANGLGLEEGLVPLLDAAAADGVAVLTATDHVDLLEPGTDDDEHADDEHADDEHADEAHDHGEGDPHIWFDPDRMADVVVALGAALTDVDDTVDWESRAAAVAEDLRALDAELADTLAAVPDDRRVLVTNHEVLGYLADRYDLQVVATLIPGGGTLAEPSASALEDIIDVVRDTGVPAIFAETSSGSRLAEVVAEEVGADVQVVELYTESLSEPDGPAATYAAMMRTNVQRIADALAG